MLIVGCANAATMYFDNTYQGGSSAHPCWDNNGIAAKYCICSGSAFTSVTCQSSARKVTYTSINTGHAGTATDPYVLSGCSHNACVCNYTEYWTGSACAACATSPITSLQTYGGASSSDYHNNTKCGYCGENNYWGKFSPYTGVELDVCYPCPNNGKKASSTGGITECCLDANATASDDTGTYTCTSKSCYSN